MKYQNDIIYFEIKANLYFLRLKSITLNYAKTHMFNRHIYIDK